VAGLSHFDEQLAFIIFLILILLILGLE